MLIPWDAVTVWVYLEDREWPEPAMMPPEWGLCRAWFDLAQQGVKGIRYITRQPPV